jgi:hypothetical protein
MPGTNTPQNNDKPKELEIEVFKTGLITDSEGETKDWTMQDLETIATTYNERIVEDPGAEAPIVKGHPETDAPAYGWVKGLKVVGDKLKAVISIVSTFAEEVSNEMFKKVSIALYPDLMLRHIGFLGAAQPAVKGLEPVKFNRQDKFKELKFADPVPPVDPAAASADQTVNELLALQKERETTYGIGPKDKIGYVQKPKGYTNIPDDQFADPVNYLYPLDTKENLMASMKTYDRWDSNYTKVEQQIILSRLLTACSGLGIEVTPKIQTEFYFNDGSTFTIALNEKLKRDKPVAYSEYEEGDFGDPVHFRFPLKTKSNVKASMAIFSRENVKSQYSENEQQYIASRIILAAQNNSIELTPKTWEYIDVPVDMLNKNQLVDVVNRIEQKNKFLSNNNGDKTMFKDWLTGLIAAMTQKLSENVNEQTATQFQSWVDEYQTANPMPADTAASEPAGGTTNSEPPAIPKEFAERMATLERENRTMKFNNYIAERKDKGNTVPAQDTIIHDVLEMAHAKGTAKFSEKGVSKDIPAVDLVKKLIESFPTQVEMTEVAKKEFAASQTKATTIELPKNASVNPDSEEFDNRIKKYVSDQKALGIEVDYFTALAKVAAE